MVECSFITEFEDHIFVTIDAEGFFFLHDLISSYLKEKEKVRAILLFKSVLEEPDYLSFKFLHVFTEVITYQKYIAP